MPATITEFLGADHDKCDEHLLEAETLASKNKWQDAGVCLHRFIAELEAHFTMEEQVLFPALEEARGNRNGPTAVMRSEHAQMRALLEDLRAALQARDADSYAGHSETLNILMQQHNMKEENILYRMADRALPAAAVIQDMRECAGQTVGLQQ